MSAFYLHRFLCSLFGFIFVTVYRVCYCLGYLWTPGSSAPISQVQRSQICAAISKLLLRFPLKHSESLKRGSFSQASKPQDNLGRVFPHFLLHCPLFADFLMYISVLASLGWNVVHINVNTIPNRIPAEHILNSIECKSPVLSGLHEIASCLWKLIAD